MLSDDLVAAEMVKGTHLVVEERGGLVEAIHRAHVAVVDSNGRLLYSSGDPDHVTYTRSCIKPVQALPVLYLGAAEGYSFTDEEVVMICASHSGEEKHLKIIKGIMEKVGISIDDLGCPGHAPFHKDTAKELNGSFTRLHDNCSGKHTGAIALCKHKGWDISKYLDLDHPLNMIIMETISSLSGIAVEDIHLGKDGCDIPNYGIPISKMAYLFARIGDPGDSDWRPYMERIRDVFLEYPYLIAGTDRFDTIAMKDYPGILISKAGAAGLQSMALKTEDGWVGISIKIEDGAYPAVETLSCRILEELVQNPGEECRKKYLPKMVRTRSKAESGSVFALGTLKELGRSFDRNVE